MVKLWESKNAQRALKGSGLTLMAMSLTACGSDSDDAAVVTPVTPTVDAAKNIALKTTVDLAPDTTGGTGADVYVADNTGSANTLTAADELNGGDGTDTLKIYSSGDGDVAGNLTSIEVVSIYDLDDEFDLTDVTGVSTLNVIRGDGTQSIKVDAGETVNLENFALKSAAGTDVSIDFGATATSATIGLNKIVAGGTAANDDVTLVGAKLATVNVNVTGTKSVVEKIDAVGATAVNINADVALETNNVATTSAAATLTITGAGKVDVGALDAGFTTVNASGNSGGLVASIGTNDQTVLTGSAGDDVITASTTDALASTDKLAVNAGAGSDTLIIAAAADVNTAADGARYTGFEVLSVSDSQDVSLVAGIQGVTFTGTAASKTLSNVTDQAITVAGDPATAFTISLKDATGSDDSVVLNLKSATATTNIDIVDLSVAGAENLLINSETGTNATTFVDAGTSDIDFVSGGANKLKAVTITGSKDLSLDTANMTVAAVINASALTGDFSITGALATGSSVVMTANADKAVVSTTNGTSYNMGAGNDTIQVAVANLVATGASDNSIDGGEGTDTLNITNAGTVTDNHFTNVSNVEKLLTGTGDTSITTGAAFNAAFADGAIINTGTLATTSEFSYAGGLHAKDTSITIDASLLTGASTEDTTITTGAGDDTVTFTATAATYVGAASGNAIIAIDTGAGDDTISITVGDLALVDTDQAITIDAGLGSDTITLVKTNAADAKGVAIITIDSGDSTSSAYDTIKGYDAADTTFGDVLNFDSTAAVATAMTTVDFNTVLSHSISNGVVSFDDAAAYSTAIKVTDANLADVIGYLSANATAGDSVAFLFDKDADGTNDSTFVFNQSATVDSLVLLDSVTLVGLSTTATLTTTDYGIIA